MLRAWKVTCRPSNQQKVGAIVGSVFLLKYTQIHSNIQSNILKYIMNNIRGLFGNYWDTLFILLSNKRFWIKFAIYIKHTLTIHK
jgi:hypothetical protein